MLESFKLAYPVFASYSDFILESALCEAEAECGGKRWGVYIDECKNFKRRGIFLYAAHYIVTTYPDGENMNGSVSSVISSKSVGDESTSFAVPVTDNAGDAWLASSGFGQQWMRLRKRAGMGALVV